MNLVKIIAVVVGSAVVIVFGMNQYESYKLNSRANNAVDLMKTNIENAKKEKAAILQCEIKASMINSSLAMEKSRALIDNRAYEYPQSLSFDDFLLFGNVLDEPIEASDDKIGSWKKIGEHTYSCVLANDKKVEFKYDNTTGKFECTFNCSGFYQADM